MGHWLLNNKDQISALVVRDCYGNRKEIGRSDLMGMYTLEQLTDMYNHLCAVQTREQSIALLGYNG